VYVAEQRLAVTGTQQLAAGNLKGRPSLWPAVSESFRGESRNGFWWNTTKKPTQLLEMLGVVSGLVLAAALQSGGRRLPTTSSRLAFFVSFRGELMFIELSKAENRPVEWLWPERIPLGSITNLEADAGSAKTTCALDIAARVTTGRPMPDGTVGVAPSHVVLFAAEDNLTTTLVPRLVATGADLSRVTAYDSEGCHRSPFRIPDDLPRLDELFERIAPKLVIFDPITAFIDSASTSDVRMRRSIGPLAQLAAKHKTSVLSIRHFRKSETGKAIHRGAGSIAFAAAARSVLAIVPDPNSDDEYRRVLVQSKSNLGAAAQSFALRSVLKDGATTVEWLGPCDYTAGDLLVDLQMGRSHRAHAMFVLYSLLQAGLVRSDRVAQKAREAGVSKRTLDRAKHDLRVRARKHGNGMGSFWTLELPDDPALLAALRSRDMEELMDALCHGVPDFADDGRAGGKARRRRDDHEEEIVPE
jgi:hypothetical protein